VAKTQCELQRKAPWSRIGLLLTLGQETYPPPASGGVEPARRAGKPSKRTAIETDRCPIQTHTRHHINDRGFSKRLTDSISVLVGVGPTSQVFVLSSERGQNGRFSDFGGQRNVGYVQAGQSKRPFPRNWCGISPNETSNGEPQIIENKKPPA